MKLLFILIFRSQIYSLKDLFIGKKLFSYSMVMVLSALTVELCGGVLIFDMQVSINALNQREAVF